MTILQNAEFTIQDDFPPVDYDQWRAVVEKGLAGASFDRRLVWKTYEGIDVQPIYTRRDEIGGNDPFGFPGLAAFIRGSRPLGAVETGWDLRQEFADPSLSVTNQAILDDLAGGVTSVLLKFDHSASKGMDPDESAAAELVGRNGIMAYCVDDLAQALDGVHQNMIQVAIDAGAAFLPASAMLVALWQRLGISPRESRGAFNADPLSALARHGQLPVAAPTALVMMADLAKWTAENYPGVTAVGVDTAPYHDAGATAVQDIAFAAATGIEYLRATTNAGLSVGAAAEQILFRMNLGTNHFLSIAKLRAARWVWCRALEVCGVSGESSAMRIHARTGNRSLTQHDPYVNLLRNSVAVFSAGLGGADAITSIPFDALAGLPSQFSRRVARNTVLVLQDESHLNRVIDPAGGSWFLDQLTKDLASQAWEIFQETERRNGMLSALTSGWISEQIDAAYLARAKDVASRKQGITGVSEFPDLDEARVVPSPPDLEELRLAAATRIATARASTCDLSGLASASANGMTATAVLAAAKGATMGQIGETLGFGSGSVGSMAALTPRNLAEPYEQLRDACDSWKEMHGHRPKVFLANLGPASHHGGRSTWSKNFFETGGFEVIGNEGFENAEEAAEAFGNSGAAIAVICSSDKLYPDLVPQAAAKLKGAGASAILLAGNPGENEEAWKAAGVDQFIFMKCNVLETLRELLRHFGVIERNNQSHE